MNITGSVPLESLIGSIVTNDDYEFDGHVVGFRVCLKSGDILISLSTGQDIVWGDSSCNAPSFHCQSAS